MKRLNFQLLVLLLIGLTAGFAWAGQMDRLMNVDIPFDFVVGNRSLPSGQYVVLGTGATPFIWIREANSGKHIQLIGTTPELNKANAEQSLLQFRKYGDSYFLAKIVVADKSYSKVVSQSKREREVALAAAGTGIGAVKLAQIQAK
jgi:hypothetical protein